MLWHDYYCEWPSLDEDFVLAEGQRYAPFTLVGLSSFSPMLKRGQA
jgi:hypothetical protein